MFQSKKQLKRRIAELEKELATRNHHEFRSALVEKADLPKCKSVACYNCKYVTFLYHPINGSVYLLGCGKDLAHGGCEDYEHTDENKPPLKDRYYELLSKEETCTQYQSICEENLCEHSPLRPYLEEELKKSEK